MSDEPREGGSVPKRLRPTNLGRIAINHGVLTEPCWWAKQAEEANRLADEGVEWELMLSERIDGLSALLVGARMHGLDWLTEVADESCLS
jgi:hypothetical protein